MYIKEYAFTLIPENLKFLEIRHQTGSRANGKNTKSTVTNKIKNKKWAAEPTHPLLVFHEAGYEVNLVLTEGGQLEIYGYSNPSDAGGYSAQDAI
ncbi:type 1 glutamine amidotransferase family protein [Flavihumibacter profundi]|uniref:hypothetical protein n=1 Tax=Flavihumibacter profundi TaxID=2716883 RepID=UPI001CC67A29|nr:hypothetical protein [Flavihumibacter profundi]MBZ5856962.1 hypothetical protein [Flavihumibacter profundi]